MTKKVTLDQREVIFTRPLILLLSANVHLSVNLSGELPAVHKWYNNSNLLLLSQPQSAQAGLQAQAGL